MSRFSIFCRNFFVSQCRKYSQVNPSVLCFRKFPVAKKFMDKRAGVSNFSVENFLPHSAEIFHRGILYCCSNFWYRKSLDKKGGVSRFFVENFLSHSAENLRRESFTVALISGTEKVWIRGRGYQDIPSKIFCLTVPKKFVGESFSNSINSGIEKC